MMLSGWADNFYMIKSYCEAELTEKLKKILMVITGMNTVHLRKDFLLS